MVLALLVLLGLAACNETRTREHPEVPSEPPRQTQERMAEPAPWPPHPPTEEGQKYDMPPPYLLPAELAALGSQAGDLLGASPARARLEGGRLALGDVEVDLPWEELHRPLSREALLDALASVADRAGIRAVPASPAIPSSASLVGRVTAQVHRAGEGHVSADYTLCVAIVDSSGVIPWATVVGRAKEGSTSAQGR